MGRFESLTAWALGRTPYEDEVVESDVVQVSEAGRYRQQYNARGHPRNPESRRRERQRVRAANEVMQIIGVVENTLTAKSSEKSLTAEKNDETFTGLRLMEIGRNTLFAGVWGVLGIRRRILIYKPYAHTSFLGIFRGETGISALPSLLFSGFPTVIAYHISDYGGLIVQACLDEFFDEEEGEYTARQRAFKHIVQLMVDIGFCYITLHYRMFAILQQLNMIPGSRFLPSSKSFIPFSAASPLQLPPAPSLSADSITSWLSSLFVSAFPMTSILVHGRVKFFCGKLLYRPIYKCLPRPTGESIFTGLPIEAPLMEYDAPDQEPSSAHRGGDADDARASRVFEASQPMIPRNEAGSHTISFEQTGESSDEDGEMPIDEQTAVFSIEVQSMDEVPGTVGVASWTAEVQHENEPEPSPDKKNYRVTGLTMLPTILAAEGFRELSTGLVVVPLEAIMVRVIGRAYRQSAGADMSDLYEVFEIRSLVPAWRNLLGAFASQVAITGVVWFGLVVGAQWWARRRQEQALGKENTS